MNERERFIQTMTGGNPDRPSYGDYFSYESTRLRWEKEGMPKDINLFRHFGFDHIDIWNEDCISCGWGFNNLFERELLENSASYEIWREGDGSVTKYIKNAPPPAMPQYIFYPVRDRKSWDTYKKRLLENDSKYLHNNLNENSKMWSNRTTPLGLWAGSSYGIVRNIFGIEILSTLTYDDPDLIKDVVETFTDTYVINFKKVVQKVELDWVMFWEDMAYKNASLINPLKYKELFISFYQKIMPLVESAGIKVVMLDSDGNIEQLIPIWLDLGINIMHPMEVAAGMDVRKMRKKYGSNIKFLGGIDKRALAQDKEAIDKEVIPKVKELIEDGGFIVECDHAVPPDVSYDNYRYYRDLIRKLCEK